MSQEILKTYPFSKQNKTFSKILFFPQLLSSGTILTITFEMSEALVLLKTIYSDLSGQPQTMFFNCENHRAIILITRP